MTPDRWQKVEELYHAALKLEENQRASFLAEACVGDEELRHEVESLLASDQQGDSFLDSPVLEVAARAMAEAGPPSLVGRQLGAYQILAPLGAGGMGEVYKARDTRLNRTVAIKVLPRHLSERADLRQRFEREARALASLSHSHICPIHDIGKEDGIDFLVMEYLEGETLAKRLKKGPLPIDQTLRTAIEIAEALDQAHRKGVIHRDLKPGNVMLTKAGAKLLDFGLAKQSGRRPLAGDWSPIGDGLPHSKTKGESLTEEGMLLGTLEYMAPEQVEGKPADTRTDIFAFGVMLYEMVTGKKAFEGKSRASLTASILTSQPPPVTTIQPLTPRALERVVGKCLQKDPEERWQSARDLASELKWIMEEISPTKASKGGVVEGQAGSLEIVSLPERKRAIYWPVTGLLALTSLILGVLFWRSTLPVSQPLMRLRVELPDFAVTGEGSSAILSPDGTRVVYTGQGVDGKSRLYTRRLDQGQTAQMAGTDNAKMPFFSPDGQFIGFFGSEEGGTSYKLKKISVEGGGATVLCDVKDAMGGSWGEDGNIIAALNSFGPLSQISSGGGTVQPVKQLDPGKKDYLHYWPQVLPGTEAVLYTAQTFWAGDEGAIEALSLRTGETKTLVRSGYYGRYVPSGHLLYISHGTLYAAPMDVKRLELTGPVAQVVENVATDEGLTFDVDSSRSGEMVYVSSKTEKQTLVWLDSTGHTQLLRSAAATYGPWGCHFSPEGKRLLMSMEENGNTDLWLYELERDSMTRLTFAPEYDGMPVWTPDGKHVLFASAKHGGALNLYWMQADGGGEVVRLTESKNNQLPLSFSPDGKWVAFNELSPQTIWDLWMLPLEEVNSEHPKPGKPEPYLVTPFYEFAPSISPDGRWLAYLSNESGPIEVYVRPFPGPGGKLQISTGGASGRPVWSKTAKELFYGSDQGMMVASYTVKGEAFVASKPRLWAEKKGLDEYDLAPDGKRFVIVQPVPPEQKGPTHVTFLLNFFDELRRRAPAK